MENPLKISFQSMSSSNGSFLSLKVKFLHLASSCFKKIFLEDIEGEVGVRLGENLMVLTREFPSLEQDSL